MGLFHLLGGSFYKFIKTSSFNSLLEKKRVEYFLSMVNAERDDISTGKDNIVLTELNGRRIPLYTEDELKAAKKHRKKKRREERFIQPKLFLPENQSDFSLKKDDMFDPEASIARMHSEAQRHQPWKKTVSEEVRYKNAKLRERIGLPVARGKDAYVGDKFYKFLVKRVYIWDMFGIFAEFNSAIGEIPDSLNTKIDGVRNMVNEVLNPELGIREKFSIFNEFAEEHKDKD